MRRILLSLVLCSTFFMPFASHAQDREGAQMKTLPQGELDVVKVLLAQERSWNKGDMPGFISGYKNSPDTVFIGSEVARGYDQMVARYTKNYPDRATMGHLTFTDLEPHLLDEKFAVVTGQFALERPKKNGGNAGGIFSLVLEKTDTGWKIVLDHTS
jgi:ketosteroid isomerase-like protein